MKRRLLIGLLLAAVIVLLPPGIVGRVTERVIERQLAPFAVTEECYDRGWFTSSGRHRLPLRDARLLDMLDRLIPAASGAPPALLVDSRIDHGLLPLGAAAREPAAALPALASGVSTLVLELADGSRLPIPGRVASRIGLAGDASLRYRLPAGEGSLGDARLAWQAGELTLESSADGRRLSLGAALDEGRVTGPAGAAAPGHALAPLEGWAAIGVHAESRVEGERLETAWHLQAEQLILAGERYAVRFAGSLEARAGTAAAIARRLQPEAGTGDRVPYPGYRHDLRRLLAAGFRLQIDEFELTTPHGPVTARVELALPASDGLPAWPRIALALQGTADLAVPRALVDSSPALEMRLRPLIAGGFLRPGGDFYRLRAEFGGGEITVNGAPMVLPPRGFQGF